MSTSTDERPPDTRSSLDIPTLRYSSEVTDALSASIPVVALESTIISHGLPRPQNLDVAQELEEIVRSNGACPATIAVVEGRPCIGLEPEQLKHLATDDAVHKLSMRDLAMAMAVGATGATTVSGTAHLAAFAGLRVFATGGLGGVHRGWIESWDESADLDTLRRSKITIVCAGVKSILDVGATLERLETLNVSVAGYDSEEFPGFYLRSSGYGVHWNLHSVEDVVRVMASQDVIGAESALIVANPIATQDELDRALHDRVLEESLALANESGMHGQELTPFLLDRMARGTDGASLRANLAAVRANVDLAARIAVCWTASGANQSTLPS